MHKQLVTLLFLVAAGCGGTDPAQPSDNALAGGKADGYASWQRMLTCDNGAAVLDVNTNERRNLQFVIRDPNIIGYFNSVGAAHSAYGARELILSGYAAHVDFGNAGGPAVSDYPYGGQGVFQPGDFHELIADYNYYQGNQGAPFERVFRDGDGIKVQYSTISGGGQCTRYQGEDCSGLVDGYPCQPICVEATKRQFQEQANWYFQHCQ